jgi:glutathione S-transferase
LTTGTNLQPPDDWSKAQALQWMFFEQYSHEPYVAVARFWLSHAPSKEAFEQKRALIPEWARARECGALRDGDAFDAP